MPARQPGHDLRFLARKPAASGPLLLALLGSRLALAAGGAAGAKEPIRLPPIEVKASCPLTPDRCAGTPAPPYPAAARQRGIEGVVLLEVKVLVDGRAGEVRLKASSGSPVLDEAGLRAVSGWTFGPVRRGPRSVESWVEVPVKFALTSR